MKDLLRVSDLTGDDLTLLLRLAADFQAAPDSAHDLLARRIVCDAGVGDTILVLAVHPGRRR